MASSIKWSADLLRATGVKVSDELEAVLDDLPSAKIERIGRSRLAKKVSRGHAVGNIILWVSVVLTGILGVLAVLGIWLLPLVIGKILFSLIAMGGFGALAFLIVGKMTLRKRTATVESEVARAAEIVAEIAADTVVKAKTAAEPAGTAAKPAGTAKKAKTAGTTDEPAGTAEPKAETKAAAAPTTAGTAEPEF